MLTMGLRKTRAAAVALAFFVAPAHAQAPSAVYVMGEADDADMNACNVTYASSISAIEAALRYNGVKVASRAAAMTDQAIRAYVSLTIIAGSSVCSASVRVDFDNYQYVNLPESLGMGSERHSKVLFCSASTLLTGRAYDFQSRINSSLRDFTDECISEMSKG